MIAHGESAQTIASGRIWMKRLSIGRVWTSGWTCCVRAPPTTDRAVHANRMMLSESLPRELQRRERRQLSPNCRSERVTHPSDTRDIALGLAVTCTRVGVAAGRLALLPLRLAAQAPVVGAVLERTGESLADTGRATRAQGRDQLEAVAVGVLTSPEAERAVDQALAGPLPEAIARSLIERQVVRRVVEQVLASAEVDAAAWAVARADRRRRRRTARRRRAREPGRVRRHRPGDRERRDPAADRRDRLEPCSARGALTAVDDVCGRDRRRRAPTAGAPRRCRRAGCSSRAGTEAGAHRHSVRRAEQASDRVCARHGDRHADLSSGRRGGSARRRARRRVPPLLARRSPGSRRLGHRGRRVPRRLLDRER